MVSCCLQLVKPNTAVGHFTGSDVSRGVAISFIVLCDGPAGPIEFSTFPLNGTSASCT